MHNTTTHARYTSLIRTRPSRGGSLRPAYKKQTTSPPECKTTFLVEWPNEPHNNVRHVDGNHDGAQDRQYYDDGDGVEEEMLPL